MNLKQLPLIAAACLLAACSTTDHGARVAGQRPSNLQSTEASMWYEMSAFEKALPQSGRVIEDPALRARASDIACTLAGDHCADMRVYIVRDPSFNASMAPNGMMLIHSGLLLRAETEDEVAFVLGHEFVHFLENHSLERYGAVRNANIAGTVVGTVLGGAGAGAFSSLGYAAAMGGAFSFSRDQELEADRMGLEFVRAKGFDPAGAAAIWKNLLTELEATSNKKKAKDINRNGMFDTHPLIQERIRLLDSAAVVPPQTDDARRSYRALIRPHLQDWLLDVVADGDHGSALALTGRLQGLGEDDGVIQYVRARIYLMRGEDGDKVSAETALTDAITHPDAPPAAWRELGTLHRERGDLAKAAGFLRTYLDTSPSAPDRALVESYISDLEETPT